MKRAAITVLAICCCALAGCFTWSEDTHGNLQSVGVPGLPIWQSKTPPTSMTPTEMGFTPEEAAKMSGPVLVEPPSPPLNSYRYRYYQTGHNNCQEDLQKMLAERATSNATGPAPYCTDNPTAPPIKGNAFIF